MCILEVNNLFIEYDSSNVFGKKQTVHAVNGVSFKINKGEIFSIAGESGCGKSSLLKSIIGLNKIKSGDILYKGLKQDIQMVFQSPSLNPKMKIKDILTEPLIINKNYLSKLDKFKKVCEVLNYVGLSKSDLEKFPHEFSGGQKQRISIARALILEPKIILADEPVSALDVSIQGQIINLLKSLRDRFNLTIIFVSHDLNVIRYISDKVAIMYLGEIIELGTTDDIFKNTHHPYSKALLSSNPACKQDKLIIKGELPSPVDLPMGCMFHSRCTEALSKCFENASDYKYISDSHFVKCHLY